MLQFHASRTLATLTFAVGLLMAGSGAALGQDGAVHGRVEAAAPGGSVAGADVMVRARDSERRVSTAEDGTFTISGLPPGRYTLEAASPGYRPARRQVVVGRGQTVEVVLRLEARPVELGGIDVSVLRPDLRPQTELGSQQVREANPKDSGELLRRLSGLDAVRRGPLGLDPSVRGLRETEVGIYLDGRRMFPAGPARMDSPLTHLDPSMVGDLQVVKGPYALTWGAGNLSAVRVTPRPLPEDQGVTGRLGSGYDTNLGAAETTASVSGRTGRIGYRVSGAWRNGDDYETGDGTRVPGDFRSAEARARVGVELARGSEVSFSAGYQDQGPIDYPGRLLTAKYFETGDLSGRWELERDRGLVRAFEALAYTSGVEHGMDNTGKPTALPDPDRMPPFALDIAVDSEVEVRGGRIDAVLVPADRWEVELGGDVYSAGRDAVRTIRRDDDGQLLFEDLMWPDATITDGGVFARLSRRMAAGVRVTGTVRMDLVEATADSVSDFFRAHTTGALEQEETHLSGAFTFGVDLDRHWTLSAGVGTSVRTADATERYSDRIPATKAQTSAEFMGNPSLEPERSNQADLWLEGSYDDLVVRLDVFARRVEDYITLEPTELEPRLPLSPPTVFRYVNGEATFWGWESSASVGLSSRLRLEGDAAYLWGRDERLDEPALGVHPFRASLGLRWEQPDRGLFAEATVEATGEMDRDQVALTRGEGPTASHVTARARGGIRLMRGLDLRIGIDNLTDRSYANHLNARNPYTGEQVPEPGRVLFADLSYGF